MICVDYLTKYPNRPFGHDEWCHLFESESNLEALHNFAQELGLKRRWFQDDPRFPHYDLTRSKHMLALTKGATLVGNREVHDYYMSRRTLVNEDAGA